jgi:hypothetical protein
MKFSYIGPFKSNRKNKKFYVIVTKGNKTKRVDYGDTRYEDYTEHKDRKRRARYITRASMITNKLGKLTRNDPFSPNYWSMRKLWNYYKTR